MVFRNYKVVIVYASGTGNTKKIAELIEMYMKEENLQVDMHPIEEYDLKTLTEYDSIVLGTYTWGDGEIPYEMELIYDEIEDLELKDKVTAVFGSGDTCYPKFCGAVNEFRDMLYHNTNLAVTLKIEIKPQERDKPRCKLFVDKIIEKLEEQLH